MDFTEIVPISALEGLNVDHFLDVLKSYLPAGPKYYPDDQISDHPEQTLTPIACGISSLVRCSIFSRINSLTTNCSG